MIVIQIEKEFQKRNQKYEDARMKATKARNEYMLCMDSANASIQKYFADDLSDLIDVSGIAAAAVVVVIDVVLLLLMMKSLRTYCFLKMNLFHLISVDEFLDEPKIV